MTNLEEISPLKHMLCRVSTLDSDVYLSNLPGHVWNVSLHGLVITAFVERGLNGGQHSIQHLKHLPCCMGAELQRRERSTKTKITRPHKNW